MRKLIGVISLFMLLGLLSACGRGKVDVTNDSFEDRIVVQGLIFPGESVENILITRNVRLDENFGNLQNIILEDAEVSLTDEASGTAYPLSFNGFTYGYEGDGLEIVAEGTYTLAVKATVNGRVLEASTSTTVPPLGFRIEGQTHERLAYRLKDANGEAINPKLTIRRSPNTTYYLTTIKPRRPSSDNFIYDNPFTNEKPKDVDENIDDYNYAWDWIQNTPLDVGESTIELFWFYFWFYDSYTIKVYATDQNYRNFMQTFSDVQEPDGNFHEPVFRFDGEGIGFFGSALVDSVTIDVVRE